MLAPSITRYSNSFVSFKRLMQTHFPLHSELTVWYDPDKPNRAYVERYSGMDKFYKWFGIGFGLALVLVYGIVILAFLSKIIRHKLIGYLISRLCFKENSLCSPFRVQQSFLSNTKKRLPPTNTDRKWILTKNLIRDIMKKKWPRINQWQTQSI